MFPVGPRGIRCALIFLLGCRLLCAEVTVHGRVVDEANAPVAGAVIALRSGDGQASPAAVEASSDPTGAFRAVLPQPGSYRVTISQPDFFRLVDRPVEIHDGPNELVLVLNHIRNTSESIDVRSSPEPIDIEQTDLERRLSGKQIFE